MVPPPARAQWPRPGAWRPAWRRAGSARQVPLVAVRGPRGGPRFVIDGEWKSAGDRRLLAVPHVAQCDEVLAVDGVPLGLNDLVVVVGVEATAVRPAAAFIAELGPAAVLVALGAP